MRACDFWLQGGSSRVWAYFGQGVAAVPFVGVCSLECSVALPFLFDVKLFGFDGLLGYVFDMLLEFREAWLHDRCSSWAIGYEVIMEKDLCTC